ncbi:MAG: ligand-binding protein [Aeromicrobium sp.]|nr:ligand-binding protein [Aeromicrobium sp.]
MADSRHRHAAPRTIKRRRTLSSRVLLPIAGLLTLAGVCGGVVAHEGGGGAAVEKVAAATPQKQDLFAASVSQGQVPPTVSRSAERAPLPDTASVEDTITGMRFAVKKLQVHADANPTSPVLAAVAKGNTVDITGVKQGGWTQIVHKDAARWVKSSLVAKQMPVVVPKVKPLGTSPCPAGKGSESGLQPDTVKVLRAVCAKFPSIQSYGGVAGRGEHATGHSLDIMVGVGNPVGDEVAAFLQEHRADLGIEYLIWKQRIWRPATSPGWRGMENRGGATANHMDHVHVTTYGSAATS